MLVDIFFGMYGVVYVYLIFMLLGGVVVEMFNFNLDNWYMGKIVIFVGYFYVMWILIDWVVYDIVKRMLMIFKGIFLDLIWKVIKNICG